MDYIKIEKDELMMWLKEHLSEKRYTHSIGTAECAQDLAKRFNELCEAAENAEISYIRIQNF